MPAEDLMPIEKPTGLHRYVKRPAGMFDRDRRTVNVHQQEWSVVDFTTGSNGVERLEWRDVPLVEEVDEYKDSEGRTIADRRRKGLPDREKPPLGQPPSWLQEQDAHARSTRADASLAKQLQTSIERNAELNAIVQRQGKALEWIANDPGAHPANMVAVAKQGLGRS